MKIIRRGSNVTLVQFDTFEILVSYETPVAGFVQGGGAFRTKTKFSRTTSKHITQYLNEYGLEATELDQGTIESLMSEKTVGTACKAVIAIIKEKEGARL